jgi:hypothetical protein
MMPVIAIYVNIPIIPLVARTVCSARNPIYVLMVRVSRDLPEIASLQEMTVMMGYVMRTEISVLPSLKQTESFVMTHSGVPKMMSVLLASVEGQPGTVQQQEMTVMMVYVMIA